MMEIIPAGTHFSAGCTPDGACWPDFTSQRPVYIRDVPLIVLKGRNGIMLSGPESAIAFIHADTVYLREDLIAHEIGHDNCVTAHADGETHCWRDNLPQ